MKSEAAAAVENVVRYTLAKADCLAALQHFADESVDLVITDPAYESLEKHRAKGTTTRLALSKKSSNEWFPIFPNSRFPELLNELWRVMKRGSHLYIFCDDETSDVLRAVVHAMPDRRRFTWWKRIVWDKDAIGMGYHYRNQHEFIVFLEKGKRRLNSLSTPSVLRCKGVRKGYPTEKPEQLCRILVNNSAKAGDLVLDPFCGSSPVGAAALKHGCNFIGIDVVDKALEVSRARLGALVIEAKVARPAL